MQLFDSKNLPKTDAFADLWPELVGYKEAFKAKWADR